MDFPKNKQNIKLYSNVRWDNKTFKVVGYWKSGACLAICDPFSIPSIKYGEKKIIIVLQLVKHIEIGIYGMYILLS